MNTTTLLSVIAICASLTLAHGQSYIANLDGAQDGGGARQGSGTVTLTLSGTTLSLSGVYSGITTDMSGGHIHGASGPFPASAGVRYNLIALGILSGTTSGTFNGGSITLADIGAYTLAQQTADLNNGLWYINIHNSTFPGGEIRGVISVVPEPSTLALLGLGAGGLLYGLRRRNRYSI